MLHFEYANPNLGSKWTYLPIFNNSAHLGNHGILVTMTLEKATRESERAAHPETAKQVCTRAGAQASRCAPPEATGRAEKAAWLEIVSLPDGPALPLPPCPPRLRGLPRKGKKVRLEAS